MKITNVRIIVKINVVVLLDIKSPDHKTLYDSSHVVHSNITMWELSRDGNAVLGNLVTK